MRELTGEEQFFRENEARLMERFAGKVVVIRGCRVVGVYENSAVAEREAAREFGTRSFLVKGIGRRALQSPR